MLFDHNDFMLFSFSQYDKMMEKFQKARRANLTIFEYVEANNANLPNTVTFKDAIHRLAYLYRDDEFDTDYVFMLETLNQIRNNIVHFELNMEDDVLVLLNELFIKASDYYLDSTLYATELPIDINIIKNKNLTIQRTIVADPFNKKLLEMLNDSAGWDDMIDFDDIANSYVECEAFSASDKEKIIKRLAIFENAGFIEHESYSFDDHTDAGWFYLSELCKELLSEQQLAVG